MVPSILHAFVREARADEMWLVDDETRDISLMVCNELPVIASIQRTELIIRSRIEPL